MALQTKKLTANGAKGHHKFTLTVTENSTSLADNTSSVLWSLEISPIVKNYDWVSNSGKVKYSVVLNGKTYSGAIKTYDGTSTVTIKNGTETVAHDTDGSKTLNYSFSITDSTGWSFAPGNCDADDAMELTTIARQATITAAPNFNDEQNPTITYSNPAGTAVTSLDLCITLDGSIENALAYKTVSKTETSYTYTLSEADRVFLRNATPNSNTRKVVFKLRTLIGDIEYYSEVDKILTIVNADPIIDPHIVDKDATVNAAAPGAFIRYLSDAYFMTKAEARKGATITSQSVTCGGVTVEETEGTIYDIQSGDFVFAATDSRGNTTTLPVSVPFVEYVKPTCSIGNSRPDTDGNFTLTASGAYYTGEFPGLRSNDSYIKVLYRYKVSGGSYSDWMDMAVTVGDNSYSATVDILGLDYKTTYIFQCKVADILTTAMTDELPIKSMPVFDWGENDFNFNVPVSAPSLALDGVQLDYIVEQGNSGIWFYRKYKSGYVELWGRTEVTVPTSLTQRGSIYYSDPISVAYPFTISNAYRFTSIANAGIVSASISISGSSPTSFAFRLQCSTDSMAGHEVTVFMYVRGRWK